MWPQLPPPSSSPALARRLSLCPAHYDPHKLSPGRVSIIHTCVSGIHNAQINNRLTQFCRLQLARVTNNHTSSTPPPSHAPTRASQLNHGSHASSVSRVKLRRVPSTRSTARPSTCRLLASPSILRILSSPPPFVSPPPHPLLRSRTHHSASNASSARSTARPSAAALFTVSWQEGH
jgi:hypothetical protein